MDVEWMMAKSGNETEKEGVNQSCFHGGQMSDALDLLYSRVVGY